MAKIVINLATNSFIRIHMFCTFAKINVWIKIPIAAHIFLLTYKNIFLRLCLGNNVYFSKVKCCQNKMYGSATINNVFVCQSLGPSQKINYQKYIIIQGITNNLL